ncbi:sigma 54-interacting transcriptional regulator, partial [Oscillibacter sp.]|uniref:sigma-54 interaction domain-containing protein n=1 Tax=Oscillibacter sp. TaxID=1945593 RepID=UPI0028A15555
RDNQAATNLVGNSKEMISLRKLISVIAKSDASVLITGESGVGKEVVAKEIYNKSLRSDGPFISVNCAAIPENLLESELFGYEKGAFTGAFKQKIGLFEVADGGTIMLDEIGEFPIHLQPKLLRVLQEREIRRVGGTHNIPIDVRVISATNRDLLQQVNEGKFRCDLYYRLNVVPILIPPLRQRREDVALLASSFLMQFNKKYKTSKFFLSQAVILLEQHDWLGNVRELENVVERLVIVSSGNAITPQQILTVFSGKLNMDTNTESASEFSLKEAVDQLEKKMISEALSNYKSTYKAAKILGMSQSTLVRKAKQLNIKSAKKAGLPE